MKAFYLWYNYYIACKVYTLTLAQDPKGTPCGLLLFVLSFVFLYLVCIRNPNFIDF